MDFRILGPLEVLHEGREVALVGSKQRALLTLLLVHANETLSTDRLVDGLWGERPPANAAKTVQMQISRLRKALAAGSGNSSPGPVVTRERGYELTLDPDRLDSERFERLVVEGRSELAGGNPERALSVLEEALSLWRGAPLAELAYEPFAQREIRRLEESRVAAWEHLIEAKLDLGRHAEVVAQLEALIGDHPYRERLRAQLMLALYRSDRQADALQAYQDARRALVEELGVEPGERLRELERAILAQDSELQLAAVAEKPAAGQPPKVVARSGFAGREPELSELVAGLDDALAGRGCLFLLAGEPGIGKSRLAEELLARARDHGARVLVGRCWEAGVAPVYWPWVQALRSYIRENDQDALRSQLGGGAAELATILPELRELLPDVREWQGADSEGIRFQLFESLASFLRRAASCEPLAILLDDLHAADAPSLLLLRFMAEELADAPIMIVGCYRDAEVGTDLAEALAEMSRRSTVHRLGLEGLGRAETCRLLELTMGRSPGGELAERVHAETQGNPLFAAEIGRLLASEKSPERSPGGLLIPQGVREAIGLRLRHQSESCRDVLTLASVIGREFSAETLRRSSGLQEDELFEALEEAAAVRLVTHVPGASGRMRFSHILVRDVLYMDLQAPRRLRLHSAIGETLESLYASDLDPHLAELAHHYLEAGSAMADKAIEYAERAGDRAAAQHGYEEAARHYASALRVLETAGPADPTTTCELLLSLGGALSRSGSGEEAKQVLLRGATLAELAGRPDRVARAALEYGGRFAWARASTDPQLVPLLERALAAVGDDDSTTRVRLLARLAGATRDDSSRDRRVRLAEEALEIARRSGDPATLAYALEGHWIAVEGPEELPRGDALPIGAELISLGTQIGDKERIFAGRDHRLHSLWMLADRGGVDIELDALGALADTLMSRDLGREHRDAEWFFSISVLPDACAFLGNADAAAKLYSLLLPYERLYSQAPVEAVFGSLARGLGVLATTLRRFDDAERHFEAALATERKMRARPWLAHAQHDFGAMLVARGGTDDAARARTLLAEAAGVYGELGMDTWVTRAAALAGTVR